MQIVQSYSRHPQADENQQFTDIRTITTIADLWENKFMFRYDPLIKDEIKVEELEFYEKQQDELRIFQKAKWVEGHFYWFQENKLLHPRYRKQEWV